MTRSNHRGFEGELLSPEAIRKGAYDLGRVVRTPPTIGIFDEPTRCFKANLEWCIHILGMVDLLADVVSWQDAEDENYPAILEILRFMQGTDCDVTDYRLRQKPDNLCIMQQSIDAGVTWTDIFDFSLCVTIQDKSYQTNIQNQVTYVQQSFQEIYNNYTTNYSGLPSSVYPNLEPPTGDDSALRAALCNALMSLVRTACDAAISFYTESYNSSQAEFNFLLAIAGFTFTAIALAAAIPSGGTSLVALAAILPEIALGLGIGAGLANYLLDFWQQHTIDQFQDTTAQESVACFLLDTLSGTDVSFVDCQNAVAATTGSPNAQAILDFLQILFTHDSTYAAFLEKWHNNKEYADAGIDLYCPCAEGFKVWIWSFANGMGDFTFDVGTGGACDGLALGQLVNGRIKGIHCSDVNTLALEMPFDPAWRVRSVKLYTERLNGVGNGGDDTSTFKMRPTAESNTGSINPIQGGFRPNGIDIRCNVQNAGEPFYWTGANQIWVSASVTYDAIPVSEIYLDRIEIMFVENFAKGGYTTEDDNLCA